MPCKSNPAKSPGSFSYSFPKLFCLAIISPGLQQCAGKVCRMVPGRKPKWAQLLKTQEATREVKRWSGSPATSRLGGHGWELPSALGYGKKWDLPGRRQAVLTLQHPGQVRGSPREGPLSFQEDFCWF